MMIGCTTYRPKVFLWFLLLSYCCQTVKSSNDEESTPTSRRTTTYKYRDGRPRTSMGAPPPITVHMAQPRPIQNPSPHRKPVTQTMQHPVQRPRIRPIHRYRVPKAKMKNVFRPMWKYSPNSHWSMSHRKSKSKKYSRKNDFHGMKNVKVTPFVPNKGKGKGRPNRRPRPRPRPQPTFRPPPRPRTVQVDFTQADLDKEPIVLVSIANPDERLIEVQVDLPNTTEALYVVENQDVVPGSVCPPVGGRIVPVANEVTVIIDGQDTVIVLCVGGVVVAQCYGTTYFKKDQPALQ